MYRVKYHGGYPKPKWIWHKGTFAKRQQARQLSEPLLALRSRDRSS